MEQEQEEQDGPGQINNLAPESNCNIDKMEDLSDSSPNDADDETVSSSLALQDTNKPEVRAEANQETTTTTKISKQMRVKSMKVDQEELLRLVRDEAMALPDMNIALTGMAGRFPKSDSINEFEENLRSGRDMVNDNDNSRFTCGLWNLPPRAGRLNDLSRFDYEFFGFTQDHANYIDFQLRILYEVVYESILDAGLNPANLRGTNTGVFFGLHCNEFENAMADDPAFVTNGYYAQFAVKVAQYFDFRGLTLTFDAACASGFVGLHTAIQSLHEGTVDQAIVCSSNIPIHPTGSFIFYQMQMLSPTGYSRFLDSRADGYVKSESCVSVVLQRKHLARRNYASFMATMTSVDGYKPEGITFPSDKSQERLIRATKQLAGVSTNHIEYLEAHGTGTPAGDPQEARAISSVYYPAEPEPEAEVETLAANPSDDQFVVLTNGSGQNDNRQEAPEQEQGEEERKIGPLLVGSVKTCMGHSEAASGLCALAKVALMFENELIYKSLHFDQPNTNIEALMDGRLRFVDETLPLHAKIIPLSCYGFGGSNVHVICRANERESIPEAVGATGLTTQGGLPRLVLMFGRGESELNKFFDQLTKCDTGNTKYCLTDDFLALLDAINQDKIDRLMNYRGFVLVGTGTGSEPQDDKQQRRLCELVRSIKQCNLKPVVEGECNLNTGDLGRRVHLQEHKTRWCHLVLPGLGCQWTGMARGLVEFEQFWSTVEQLDRLLEPYRDQVDLLQILHSNRDEETKLNESLCNAFVAIVAYQIGLIKLVKEQLKVNNLGSIVGHSLGEISSAYAAGLFDERETIMVAYWLGKTLDDNKHLIRGKMVALTGLSYKQLEQVVDDYRHSVALSKSRPDCTIRVSCINGPESITVSGVHEEVDQLFEWLMRERPQVGNQLIIHEVSSEVALHNEFIMNQSNIKPKLRQALERVLMPLTDYDRTKTRWISSFIGRQHSDSDQMLAKQANIEYFVEMLCRKIDFHHAIDQLESDSVIYELGPVNLFESQIVQMHDADGERRFHYVRSMQKWTDASKQVVRLLSSFGELYQAGVTFDLAHFYQAQSGGKRGKQIFPVRRQTPSVSSLFNWNHSASLFVPRYPIQFSKSSAKCEMPIDMVEDRDKYLAGHCIEGRILNPATGYLFLIWRVFSFTKRKIYDACFHDIERELVPIEFRNVRLLRAVILGQRQVQLYVHYEEATGRFEIKEGGSVVVEGFAHSPQENPNGLLYDEVRAKIGQGRRAEEMDLPLKRDDVYKQFRVSGYDYGETFQCIQESSNDGQVCRVKFNGHFVSLTDSILQSIFLAIVQYAPPGTLFLPTRFDYVRFQPEIILAKLHAAKWALDTSDGSLNTKAKRELMTKIMQRESDAGKAATGSGDGTQDNGSGGGQESASAEEASEQGEQAEQMECIFDTYCDTVTGIIVTDGIEMRGIKASPAPRRIDNNEVLLESYQFVADHEEPVRDERLTRFEEITRKYMDVCNSMSAQLLIKLCQLSSVKRLNGLVCGGQNNKCSLVPEQEIEAYMHEHLACVYDDQTHQAQNMTQDTTTQTPSTDAGDKSAQSTVQYDIKKNGQRALMSIYDQLLTLERYDKLSLKQVRQRVQDNRTHVMKDLMQNSFGSERYIRPIIETVLENVCTKKLKLRMIEVNTDDGIMRAHWQQMIQQIEPSLVLDYALAHPDPNRLHGSVVAAEPSGSVNKIHTLKDIASFFQDNHLKGLDFVVYKHESCYAVTRAPEAEVADSGSWESIERKRASTLLESIADAVSVGGYFLLIVRQELTLAELILGELNKRCEQEVPLDSSSLIDEIQSTNDKLRRQVEILLEQANELAQSSGLSARLVARRSDEAGCLMLLFRRTSCDAQPDVDRRQRDNEVVEQVKHSDDQKHWQQVAERLVLRVRHDDLSWLDELKRNFGKTGATASGSEGDNANAGEAATAQSSPTSDATEEPPTKQVWLCAVLTRQCPVTGLIGMMQALRKELGSTHLRCFCDAFTFRHQDEPIGTDQIVESSKFQEALRRDQVWCCVDETGQLGSYRHFTINDYLSYDNSLCNKQPNELVGTEVAEYQRGAYVNTATRGDLSSLSWFEAPFRYLAEAGHQDRLVRVAYSALNFRDIMLATGRLPLDSLSMRLAMADCLLGLEFSGYELDNSGGRATTPTRPRRVMGMVYGRGIATHVLCPRENAIKLEIPDWMSMAEAATIPVVYATAILAIVYRGQARRGESILIHAGSGGVGQAAIRLALHYGLTVYTTVGSADKRQFLLDEFSGQLEAANVFNSRSCDFEQDVMRATRGRGVDMVLNSLADDKLQASLRCLADGGRFLEIGKYDLSVDSQMELHKLDTNKTFHGILLDKLFDGDEVTSAFGQQLRCVQDTLKQGLREGFVQPIKFKLFKHTQIEEAFRFMATGKHMGKVLIEIDSAAEAAAADESQAQLATPTHQAVVPQQLRVKCVPRFELSAKKSYLVTGGLGGFGLELCKWLAGQGARHLVLTSRQGVKTGYQMATLERLQRVAGVKLVVVTQHEADASQFEGALKLCQIARQLSPTRQLGGLFHLAMVLKDTLLDNMSPSDFAEVCKPKLDTCQALDEATRQVEAQQQAALDYFVAFSSITSGKGNAGQANYAYANSAVERICEARHREGKHGLAIQWGAIGDVGVAYENLGGNDVIIGGTIPQRMPSCLATLAKLLRCPFPVCLSVLPVNRNQDSLNDRGDLVGAIMHVLGIKDPSKVSEDASLGDLGLDSLMAVEIRQYIEREYDMTLNIQEIRALTIARIREISDSERPTVANKSSSALDEGAAAKRKEVASYGAQKAPSGGESAEPAAAMAGISGGGAGHVKQLNGGGPAAEEALKEAVLDKRLVTTFVPPLELPQADYCRLNYKTGSVGVPADGRPIFFLAPIHGKFDCLEPICANISRPCIGLNWTRRLGQARTVDEAAAIYLQILQQTNWHELVPSQRQAKQLQQQQATRRKLANNSKCHVEPAGGEQQGKLVVDIVGYSFGATIGFELMRAIHQAQSHQKKKKTAEPSSSADDKVSKEVLRNNQLVPGRLVLLDGSPKQIELGSQYFASLTQRKPLNVAEKIDELLMVYVVANHRAKQAVAMDREKQRQANELHYLSIQKGLRQLSELEAKVKFASEQLVDLLSRGNRSAADASDLLAHNGNNSNESEQRDRANSSATSGADVTIETEKKKNHSTATSRSMLLLDEHSVDDDRSRALQMESIAHAMEAFLRRYELINSYKVADAKLAADCTLIRAEKLYLRAAATNAGNGQAVGGGGSAPPAATNISNGNNPKRNTTTGAGGGDVVNGSATKSTKSLASSSSYNEDLDLGSIVAGSVDLHLMPGDHESFLSENGARIGDIISKACSSASSALLRNSSSNGREQFEGANNGNNSSNVNNGSGNPLQRSSNGAAQLGA